MSDQCLVRCHNPACQRPLNHYAFNANKGRKEEMFCSATCYKRYSRAQAWIPLSTALDWLPGLSLRAGDDQRQKRPDAQEETQGSKAAAIIVSLATTGLASILAFSQVTGG